MEVLELYRILVTKLTVYDRLYFVTNEADSLLSMISVPLEARGAQRVPGS